jgi:Amt family ammonium transporter
MTGALGTGLLVTKAVNGNLKDELLAPLFLSQLAEILVTLILSTVATAVVALVLRMLIGLRPSPDVETAGLDLSEHGEEAYID